MAKGWTDGYKTYDTSKGFGSRSKWQGAFEDRLNLRINTEEEAASIKHIYQSLYDCKSEADLKKEYRRLMMLYHPDRAGDTEENKIIAQAINDAYFSLKS